MTESDAEDFAGGPEEELSPGVTDLRHLPPVMDANECAKLLRLKSGREALRLARQRKIPSVKVGKHRLFLLDEVIKTLRRRQQNAIEDRELGRVAEG